MGRRFSGVEVDRMRDTAAKMARLLSERVVTVAGTPTFRFYGIDFGEWDASGGIEIGLAGPDRELPILVVYSKRV